jgi:hypothetical protein
VYEEARVLDARYNGEYVDLTFRASRARALALARLAPAGESAGDADETSGPGTEGRLEESGR